jgi:hypothetical protein
MYSIISWLGSARDWLLSAYWTVDSWVYPFNKLSTPLYYIWLTFYYLTLLFGDFNNWLVWVQGRIEHMLDIYTVTSYFQTWITNATNAWNWIVNAWNNVTSIINTWWNTSNNPIRLFIEQAISTIQGLPDWFMNEFTSLKSAWDNFWSYTFPQWMTTLHDLGVSFLAFVASIGQEILSRLDAFWDETIFPAIKSVKEELSKLSFPSWDDIWSFVFSKLPWLPKAFAFFENLWEDITLFFTYPINWLFDRFSFDDIGDPLITMVEGAGGTDQHLADIASILPSIKTVSDELIDILSSEELMKADEFWADVELALNEVIAELEAAEAKKGAI